MRATVVWGSGLALALLGCAGGECDAGSIAGALATATPGTEVTIGSCRVEGSFTVPAGVTLRGQGDASVLVVPEGAVGVELSGTIASMRVESRGRVAIAARSGADATLTDVHVLASRGIGVGVIGGRARLTRTIVEGEITQENANDSEWTRVAPAPFPAGSCPAGETCDCTPGGLDGNRTCNTDGRWARLTSTVGLYGRGAELTLEDVEVRGLASFGVVLEDGTATWARGRVHEVLGVGAEVLGGTLALHDVTIERMLSGLRGAPTYALVAGGGADLDTTDLTLRDNDRYGLLQLGATGTHERLVAERHGDAAVWAQDSTGLELFGAGTRISEGSFAGVVVVRSSHVRLSDLVVQAVASSRRPVGLVGAIEVGDGVHLTGSHEDVVLTGVEISGHERAGILVELGAGGVAPSFAGVEVSATGTALGAIAGTSVAGTDELEVSAPSGWDSGILRMGSAGANDAAFTGRVGAVLGSAPSTDELLGVVAPMF